jgi:signal transduction histidine kinase
LLSGGRLLGTLAFASRTRDRFDDEEQAFLETLTRYVAVATERLRLVRQLREEARRKDRFLATLAHELRNPLAPMRSAVRVLQLEHADERELRASRAVIERQVALLGRLVDDLLDLSRVTRDKLDLRMKRIDLADAIAGAIETSRPRIDHAGHRLIVELPEEPLPLQGDLVRLAQVFLNLLNNAAKYTEPGGEIRLSAARQDGEAVVRVRDNGVGIAADQLPQLFEMFFQADHPVERSQDGLGIGLALVRRLVELHGGRVRATSDGMGKGSEFIVRLPLVAQPVRPGATARRAPAGRPPESKPGRRILIVDDHRDSADSLALLLRLEGHEVHTAYDGERGVEAAERLRPDAVLLDLGMPGLGGHEVCRRIRARDWGRRPRLIAISGWGRDEDRDRAADAGFDGHLLKPFEPAALDALLNGASRAAP